MFLRILIATIFVSIIPCITLAQNQDWNQIELPIKTSIYILHQTSQGYLFGKMSYTNQIFFSNDTGHSWRQLPDDFGKGDSDYFVIREDIDGNLYQVSNGKICSFDPQTLEINQIIQASENSFLDFSILKNGTIVIATTGFLSSYSKTGVLIKQHSWWTHTARFLLDRTGQMNFVLNTLGAGQTIIEFNDDLSFISNKTSAGPYPILLRNGDRLFNGHQYSDNAGSTWLNFDHQFINNLTTINIGHDGRLFVVTENNLFISEDNGNSFNQVNKPVSNSNYISSDLSGQIVISDSRQSKPVYLLSNDSGENWEDGPHYPGVPSIIDFEAGLDENLYVPGDYGHSEFFYKKNSWSPWAVSSAPPMLSFEQFMSFSDGSSVGITNIARMYGTQNKGTDWELKSNQNLSWFNDISVVEKSGVLYFQQYDKMLYSVNFGESWNTIITTDPDMILSPIVSYISGVNFGSYHFVTDFTNPSRLVYFNWLTGEKVVSAERPDIYPFATSYSDEALYGLRNDNGTIAICITKNHGLTFTFKRIEGLMDQNSRKIKTDHLGNIYVYTDKQIFYSSDDGNSWSNITPDFSDVWKITNLDISFDNYIYISTIGKGILKYNSQLVAPKKLHVRVIDDENLNCIADINEVTLNGIKVLLNGLSLNTPDSDGVSSFLIHALNNTVKVIYSDELYGECASVYPVIFEETDTELHLDIPLKVLKYCADPVVGISVPFLRRCFDNIYSGSVCNEGNIESINTEIEITLDPFFDFISASLPVKSINGQTLILDAGHIQPGECQSFHFVVNVNCDAELGQEHCISAYTSTDSEDCGEIPTARDAYVDCQENIGAYDPNDKNIFVNGNRNQTYIEPGDKIEYLIRFQNTGTDTAFTVRIEDPITKKFNISSLKPVAASHDYTWSVNNGMLVVIFEDIQLVDSFKNEPASHGFIKFEIQLDSLTLRGDDVKNLAGIFFDFNKAIITEEVVTVIGQPLNTKEHSFESITAFPNPANGLVYISGDALSDKPQDLMIYDIHGKLILSQKISYHDNLIDISKCAPGTYLLMMKSGEKVFRGKLLKM